MKTFLKRLLAGILSLSLVFSSAVSSISAESALPLAGNISGYVFDEMGTVIDSFDDNSIILTKSNIGMNYDNYTAVLSPDGNIHIYQKTDTVRSFILMKPDTDVSKINELLTEYDSGRINAVLPEHHTRLVKVSESGDVYMLQTRLQDINEIYDIIKSVPFEKRIQELHQISNMLVGDSIRVLEQKLITGYEIAKAEHDKYVQEGFDLFENINLFYIANIYQIII